MATSEGPVVPSDEELRGLLTDTLRLNVNPPIWPRGWERQLDALLPVVRRYADQRAAEELRVAAKWALLQAASYEGYAAKGMARNAHLREMEARVFRATSERLTDRADALTREATT